MPDEVQKTDQVTDAAEESPPLTESKHSRFPAMRELTEKELARPESVQFLLKEIERLANEVLRLENYREEYHEADKARALLEHRLKDSVAKDIIFAVNVAVGLALLGLLPAIWNLLSRGQIGFIAGAGLILAVSGVVAKSKAS